MAGGPSPSSECQEQPHGPPAPRLEDAEQCGTCPLTQHCPLPLRCHVTSPQQPTRQQPPGVSESKLQLFFLFVSLAKM